MYRIRAAHNPQVNGYWICDRGRYGYSILNGDREESILKKGEGRGSISWDEALEHLSEKIRRLQIKKRSANIAVVYSTWLTNEELFLLRKVFTQDLEARLYRFDPPEAEGDDLLLTSERTPNRRGARELGLDSDPVDLETLVSGTDILIMFGAGLAEAFSVSEIKARLEEIPYVVACSPYPHEVSSEADLLLPTALFQEKGGSVVNVDGITQTFSPALDPPGSARPEWRILVELGKKLNTDYSFYRPLENPADIFRMLIQEFSFFRK